jgi:hypothetical protein
MTEQIARETGREKIVVPFDGPGAGTAPLTWAQQALWKEMQATGLSLSMANVKELPAGTTIADLAARLSSLASRHPSLRMRLSTDTDGNVCQVASASGDLALDVVSVEGDEDEAARYAMGVLQDAFVATLDLFREWPVRLTVVRHRGVARYIIYTFSHLVADITTLGLLIAEFESGSNQDKPALDTLDLARRECTESSQRLSDRAVSYWEARLRSIPPLAFGEPTHPEGWRGHRFWHGQFGSPATHLATLAIAERTGTDSSTVLHAIITTAIARATGVNPLTVRVTVGNRFRPGLRNAIAPLNQDSVLTLDVGEATIDEVIARARRVLVAAAKYGYYDPGQVEDMTARLRAERGRPPRITFKINDTRALAARSASAPVTAEQIRSKLPETFLSWDGTLDRFHEEAWISVLDLPGTVCLQVIFDLGCVAREQAEAVLRGVEEVAVEAALYPQAQTRVSRAEDTGKGPG